MTRDTERYPAMNPPGLAPDRKPPEQTDMAVRQAEIHQHRLERAARGSSGAVEQFIPEYHKELREGDGVLEVGVGEGRNLRPFADLGRNLKLHGIDDKRNAVELCRSLLQKQGIKAEIIQGSFIDLPYADGLMRIVVSHAALQNAKTFEDARRAFAEITRVLKHGGLYLFRENSTPRLKDTDRAERVAYFTEDEVRRLVKENGFTIERGEKPVEGEGDSDRVCGKRIAWEVVFRKSGDK